MDNQLKNIAVLIDADNTPISLIDEILTKIKSFGQIGIKKIYGDWGSNHLKGWQSIILEHAIVPIHQFAYTKGKNATDISMVIDAMDLILENIYDGFCLVSSDSDFAPLAARLRASKIKVLGFGQPNTPDSFQKACDEFICFKLKNNPSKDTTSDSKPKTIPNKIINQIYSIIDNNLNQNGWVKIEVIVAYLNKEKPSFNVKDYGFSKFSTFLNHISEVEMKKEGNIYLCRHIGSSPKKVNKNIPNKLKRLILEAIKELADETGWANIGPVGSHIKKIDSNFSTKSYGFSKLSELLKSVDDIEVKKESSYYLCRRKNLPSQPIQKDIPSQIRLLVIKAIIECTDENGWAKIGLVHRCIQKTEPTFSSKNYGYSKLSDLLRKMDNIELQVDNNLALCRYINPKLIPIKESYKPQPLKQEKKQLKFNISQVIEEIMTLLKNSPHKKKWVALSEIKNYLISLNPQFDSQDYGFSDLESLLQTLEGQCLDIPKYSEKQERYYRKIPFLQLVEQLKKVMGREDIDIRDHDGQIMACALGQYAHFHVHYGKYGFQSFSSFFDQVIAYEKRKIANAKQS